MITNVTYGNNRYRNKNIRLKIEKIANILCESQSKFPIGLMSGNMGIVLFLFCYYHIHKQDERIYLKAFSLLEETIDRINDGNIFHSICDGLAGVGWVINYLCNRKYLDTDNKNELLGSADDFLNNRLNIIFEKYQYLKSNNFFIEKNYIQELQTEISASEMANVVFEEEGASITKPFGVTHYADGVTGKIYKDYVVFNVVILIN